LILGQIPKKFTEETRILGLGPEERKRKEVGAPREENRPSPTVLVREGKKKRKGKIGGGEKWFSEKGED